MARVESIYKPVIKAGIYKAASIKVAEAAKVIENSQRDLNIALNEFLFSGYDIDTYDVLETAKLRELSPFEPG